MNRIKGWLKTKKKQILSLGALMMLAIGCYLSPTLRYAPIKLFLMGISALQTAMIRTAVSGIWSIGLLILTGISSILLLAAVDMSLKIWATIKRTELGMAITNTIEEATLWLWDTITPMLMRVGNALINSIVRLWAHIDPPQERVLRPIRQRQQDNRSVSARLLVPNNHKQLFIYKKPVPEVIPDDAVYLLGIMLTLFLVLITLAIKPKKIARVSTVVEETIKNVFSKPSAPAQNRVLPVSEPAPASSTPPPQFEGSNNTPNPPPTTPIEPPTPPENNRSAPKP